MKSAYARSTEVPADRSIAEIGNTLRRFGATSFGHAWEDCGRRCAVVFEFKGRQIRFELDMPDSRDARFCKDSRGKLRKESVAAAAWEQATRSKWRSLCLAIKAKLVSVQEGIFTFEHEFAMHTVMPDGMTLAQHVLPKLESILSGAPLRGLLPARIES